MKRVASLLGVLLVTSTPPRALAGESRAQACADAYVNGQILQKEHKLVQAREVFQACAQHTCKEFIVRDCAAWLDAVQSSLAAVVPVAVDDRGNALTDIKLSMDGVPLFSSVDGRSVDVDPGLHTFTFEAPDGRKVDEVVTVPENGKGMRISATFARMSVAPAPSAIAAPPVPPRGPPASDGHVPGSWTAVGISVLSVGVLGLGIGAVYGFDAMSKKSAAGCGADETCPTEGAAQQLNLARRAGNAATVFLAAGGGLAAIGMGIWAFAPRHSIRASARLGLGGPSLVLSLPF